MCAVRRLSVLAMMLTCKPFQKRLTDFKSLKFSEIRGAGAFALLDCSRKENSAISLKFNVPATTKLHEPVADLSGDHRIDHLSLCRRPSRSH